MLPVVCRFHASVAVFRGFILILDIQQRQLAKLKKQPETSSTKVKAYGLLLPLGGRSVLLGKVYVCLSSLTNPTHIVPLK